jgi:glycosyltransferase involved in cell wall biosynthesis
MKLLIATGIYPPEIGGPAGYVKGVATELAKQGHEVAVVTYGDSPELNSKYQIANIKRGDSTLVRYAKYAYQTWRLARKSDLIYAQGPVSEGLPATIASILSRKPLVLKVVGDYAWEQYQQTKPTNIEHRTLNMEHGTSNTEHRTLNFEYVTVNQDLNESKFQVPSLPAEASAKEGSKIELLDEFVTHRHSGKIRVLEAIERWVASRAKQIIVPSKYLKTIVEKWGIDAVKIKVVYNSISPLPIIESREELRNKYELGDKKLILTAVRAVPWKGGDFLCDVLKDLPNDFVLAVAGDGPSLESWKKHAEELGVSNRIAWLGRLSRKDLTEFYQSADLFVLATGYEGFPHVVVEAASVGLPCIVSDKGGNPEIAELFPGLVTVVPYRDKQAWIDRIRNTKYEIRNTNVGLPEVLGFNRMVTETYEVLKSAQSLNLDSHDSNDSHDYSNNSHRLNLDLQADSRSNLHDYSNHNICDELSEKSRFEVRNSRFDGVRVLSIGLEKKLFEDGKVRDRIVEQLKDFDATIIVFAKQKFDEQIAPNVRVISTNSWNKFFYVTDALRIVWKLRKQKFNVITSQDPTETGLVAYLASKILKTALAIQDHGYHFHGNYYRQESWLNQFRYLFARFVVAKADAIRVVSQRTEDALTKLGVPRERIMRFPVALNSKYQIANSKSDSVNSEQGTVNSGRGTVFDGGSCIGFSKFQVPSSKFLLLVCRFVPIKRIDLAIHAFSIVAKQDPDVNLKIVGAGPLEDQIKQWIADFDLQSRVEIIPWTNDLADLYREAIATLITSDREGFGMTAVESLACGTPVIMTDVGCAGEVVKNGENGIVVPIGDVIQLSQAMSVVLAQPYFVPRTSYNTTEQLINCTTYDVRSTEGVVGMRDFLLSAINQRLSAKKKLAEEMGRFEESVTKRKGQNTSVGLLICVEAVDKNDPLMGYFTTWLNEAAKKFSKIVVLTLRAGEYDLPQNVSVYRLKEKYNSDLLSRLEIIIKLFYYSIKFRKQYDGVFSRGEPKYIILCGWLWRLMGKKTVLFFAHYKTSGLAKIANKIAHLTVTSVPEAANDLSAIPIGQAIDADNFQFSKSINNQSGVKNFLVFGRVSEVKRVVEIVQAFKQANTVNSTLTIVGKALTEEYGVKVRQEISDTPNIKWIAENVAYENVPALYQDFDILINATPGSLDKTIVEASMSGLLVIATSGGYGRVLGEDGEYLNPQDADKLSKTIERISGMSPVDINMIATKVRFNVVNMHSLAGNVNRLYNLF